MVRNWGAHRGHSRSFSPRLRALKECPHRKCTAGSSRGLPLSAHLLFWNTRTCSRIARSVIKTLHHGHAGFHEGLLAQEVHGWQLQGAPLSAHTCGSETPAPARQQWWDQG